MEYHEILFFTLPFLIFISCCVIAPIILIKQKKEFEKIRKANLNEFLDLGYTKKEIRKINPEILNIKGYNLKKPVIFIILIGIILVFIWVGIYFLFKKEIVKNEKYYQSIFCNYIKAMYHEYKLDDNSRIDIVTIEYAIEIDFDYKIYEAIGQALYYSAITELKPGIVLIIKNNKYLQKLLIVANKYNINAWTIDKNTEEIKCMSL